MKLCRIRKLTSLQAVTLTAYVRSEGFVELYSPTEGGNQITAHVYPSTCMYNHRTTSATTYLTVDNSAFHSKQSFILEEEINFHDEKESCTKSERREEGSPKEEGLREGGGKERER